MSNALPDLYLVPSGGVVRGTANVPASKSLAHRALICAALARGTSFVGPLPDGDDVAATVESLRVCGVSIGEQGEGSGEQEERKNVIVTGASGRLVPPRTPLDCRASGTTLRLMMGVCGAMEGTFTLHGVDQLRSRPVADMAGPLAALGSEVKYAEREGYPPVVVAGKRWAGGEVEVPGGTSSQFLSGLLLGSPLASGKVTLNVPDLVSSPYAEMTARVMEHFGIAVCREGKSRWVVNPGGYLAKDFAVEPDASSAAFLWGAAAVTGGEVLVRGTGGGSLQGDAVFPDLLARMGCRVERLSKGVCVGGPPTRGLDADLSGTPDLVPPLAAVATFAPGPSTFRGVAHLRFKESDRLAVLADGLSRVGATVLIEDDCMTVVPSGDYRGAELDPHGDHRMAMAFALLGLRIPGVLIRDPACVGKSFPAFFQTIEGLLR